MRLIEGLVGNDRIIVQKSLERCERYIEHIGTRLTADGALAWPSCAGIEPA